MKVLAIACHPDDMEFMMGGTLLLLRDAGCEIHYINIANGSVGSVELPPAKIALVRAFEAAKSAGLLGATHYPALVDDLEVFYEQSIIRKVTAIVRRVKPDIVLTQSLEDYMEDHMNTARIAGTATFLRNVANYRSIPDEEAVFEDVMLYHSTPHILTDMMRVPVVPEFYVNISGVMERKTAMLACHASQKEWLDKTQGFDSYLSAMKELSGKVGGMSGRFAFAEGWRRHSHVGFSREDCDPVSRVLGDRLVITAPKS